MNKNEELLNNWDCPNNSEEEYDWDISFDPMTLSPANSTFLNHVFYPHDQDEVDGESNLDISEPSNNTTNEDFVDQVDDHSHCDGGVDPLTSAATDENNNWWWCTSNTNSQKYTDWFLRYGQRRNDVSLSTNYSTTSPFNGVFNSNSSNLFEEKKQRRRNYDDRCGDHVGTKRSRFGAFSSTSESSFDSGDSYSKQSEYFSLETVDPDVVELTNHITTETEIQRCPLQSANAVVNVSTQTPFKNMMTATTATVLKTDIPISPSSLSLCSWSSDQSGIAILAARGEHNIPTLTSTSETASAEFIYKPVTFQNTFSETSYYNPDALWNLDEQSSFFGDQMSTTSTEEPITEERNLKQRTLEKVDKIMNEFDAQVKTLQIFDSGNLGMIDRGTSTTSLLVEGIHKSTSTTSLVTFGRQHAGIQTHMIDSKDVEIQTQTVDSKDVEIQTDVEMIKTNVHTSEPFNETSHQNPPITVAAEPNFTSQSASSNPTTPQRQKTSGLPRLVISNVVNKETSDQNRPITVVAESNLTRQSVSSNPTTPQKQKTSGLPRLETSYGVVNQKLSPQTMTSKQPMTKPNVNLPHEFSYRRFGKVQIDVDERRPTLIPKPSPRFQATALRIEK